MVLSTAIIRVGDGLPLVASTDDGNVKTKIDDYQKSELEECKSQTKMFLKKLPHEKTLRGVGSGYTFLFIHSFPGSW